MRRIRAVTDTDRALDAGLKALLMAAAAAAQRDATCVARELGRCLELGVRPARVWAVAALVLSSRGEGAYAHFVGAAVTYFDPPPAEPASAPPLLEAGDIDAAEAYLSARTGSLPAYALPLRDMALEAFVGYARLLQTTWEQPELSPREVQLILVCINAATIRPDFAAHHSRLARAAGATDEEIIEAGICAIPCGGVTAWYATGGELL
jgi:alkylhydroperoxidase/carboxymuconolactone decarboxylase family protein YurZ